MLRKKQGFTLIETLVVISIMAIIAGLSLPTFHHIKLQSQQKVCQQNIVTLQQSYMVNSIFNSEQNQDSAVLAVSQNTVQTQQELPSQCPANGTYTVTDTVNGPHIYCSIHGNVKEQPLTQLFQSGAQ